LIGPFEKIASGASAKCGEDGSVIVVHRQDQDRDPRADLDNPPRRVDTVAARHVDVHDDYVWLQFGREFDCIFPTYCLAHDLGSRKLEERHSQAVSNDWVIIGNENGQGVHLVPSMNG